VSRLVARGWSDFQHYKDRSPAWIKLHKKLIDNYEFQCLPVASRALAPMLWLLASEENDGSLDASPAKIAFRLRMAEQEVVEAVKPLIKSGFFDCDAECYRDASKALAERLPREREREREREEVEEERESVRDSMRINTTETHASAKPQPTARACRLPSDWDLPDEWAEWAMQEQPSWTRQHCEKVSRSFADYWHAKGGADARKADWQATWRLWVRREKPMHESRMSRDGIRDENGALLLGKAGMETAAAAQAWARSPEALRLQQAIDARRAREAAENAG